ncbi:MAG: MFS transporter [Enterocloster citroniae]|nr:MFS transporter [Enterocloster citroniae]
MGWIMTVPGKDWVAPPIPASVTNTEKADREYGPFDMLKTLRFWLMIVLMCLASMTGIMFVGALSGIAQAQLGVGTAAASWIVGISALANFVGRMGFGRVCDRLGEAKTVLIILVVTILSLFVMRNAFTIPMFIVCLIFIGAAFGGVLVCFPPFTQKVFGMENSGVNYGIMFLGYASGSYFGPQIAAKTKMLGPDGAVMATSYANAYSIAIAVGVAGIVVCFLLMYVKDRYAKQAKAA